LTAHLTDRKRVVNEEFQVDFLCWLRLFSGILILQAPILADSIVYANFAAEFKTLT
jgi:hypothetical protein